MNIETYVTETLGQFAEEHDVEAIAQEITNHTGATHMEANGLEWELADADKPLTEEKFWEIVERNRKA